MGNASSSKQKILNLLETKIESKTGASSSCTQKVKLGDITIGGKNCKVNAGNTCFAEAEAGSEAVLEAIQDTYNEGSTKQKAGFAAALNISSSEQDNENIVSTTLEQKCQADSTLMQEIEAGNITTLDSCEDGGVSFINTGNVKSDCIMSAAIDALNKSENVLKTDQTSDALSGLMGPLIIIAAIVLFIFMIGAFMKKGGNRSQQGYPPMYQPWNTGNPYGQQQFGYRGQDGRYFAGGFSKLISTIKNASKPPLPSATPTFT